MLLDFLCGQCGPSRLAFALLALAFFAAFRIVAFVFACVTTRRGASFVFALALLRLLRLLQDGPLRPAAPRLLAMLLEP